MELEQLQAKFRGALLGVAVGDALGAPFEGTRVMPHRVLDRLVRDPGPMRYTDDTHMTLGLAASLLERQGFHGNHMATAFAENFAAEPWRGYGPWPAARPAEVVQQVGNGIAAFEAVPAALYAFLRHPESFTEAVLYALSLGGDTDTIASMTGALAGAYLGERAIPAVWRERVEGAARLRELADALLAIATRARGDRGAGGHRTAGRSH